jgi:aldehyde dehydrogenase (NAD+)
MVAELSLEDLKISDMTNPDVSTPHLQTMRHFYESGATRSFAFRKRQLLLLREALLRYDTEINEALHKDLKKSPEEAYATETGMVLTEIRVALKNLHNWMKPAGARTNLLNLPSSGKIYRDPLGVVLIIAPWNYPLQLLFMPLVGAMAAGNCIVLKPSEMAPAIAAVMDRIIRETFPGNYVQLIQGDGAAIVPPLMRSFRFDHVFYTGSAAVGRAVYQMAAKDLVPVTLELGGKSPAVVESDADITSTVRRIALGKFTNAGQTCVAPDYVLVHADVKERFMEELGETIRGFFGEEPMESYSYGRIINEKRFDTLTGYLKDGRIVIGGSSNRAELIIAPTVMEDVPLQSPLMTEEIFGPILPVYSFDTMEQGLDLIRRNADPLAFYVFTSDTRKEKKWIERVAFGGGCVNNTLWHVANHHLPFGGIGTSGIGAYHGKYSFDTFTHAKPVMKTPTWFDPGIKYPPFKGKLKWFRLFMK